MKKIPGPKIRYSETLVNTIYHSTTTTSGCKRTFFNFIKKLGVRENIDKGPEYNKDNMLQRDIIRN